MSAQGVSAGGESQPNPVEQESALTSVLQLLAVLVKRRVLVAGSTAALVVLGVVYSLLATKWYTASATFVAESSGGPQLPAGLAGLASQVGISVGPQGGQTPRFFAEVLTSRELLERALVSSFSVDSAGRADSLSLLSLLEVRGPSERRRLELGVGRLRGLTTTQVNNQTGTVRVTARARNPALAAQIANRLVGFLDDYAISGRQTQAAAKRQFVDERLVDSRARLQSAEMRLKEFYERNRSWQQSPELTFEEGRLRREVELQQQVFITLNREYEQARLDEFNNMRTITVIDSAVPPTQRSAPRRKATVAVTLVVGLAAGVVLALGAEMVGDAASRGASERPELAALLRPLARWVRAP